MSDSKLKTNLRRYLFYKIAIFNFIVGYLYYLSISADYSQYIFFCSIFFVNVFYIFSIVVKEYVKNIKLLFYTNFIVDLLVINFLTFYDGGIYNSSLSLLIYLIIIAAGFYFYDKGSLILATVASILFLGSFVLNYFGYIPVFNIFGEKISMTNMNINKIMIKLFINLGLFYVTAYLISGLREASFNKDKKIETQKIFLKDIYENIYDSIFVFDKNGFLSNYNKNAESFKNNLKIGQFYKKILPEKISEQIDNIGQKKIVNKNINIENKYYDYLINIITKDNKRLGYIVSIRDITEKKHLQDKLIEMDKLAYLGKIGANVAHELRNPMASLYGSIQLLDENSFKSKDKQLYKLILNEAERLNEIINVFLNFTKGKEPKKEILNINDIISKRVKMINMLNDKNVKIIKNENCYVKGDKNLLSQAFNNLIWNAVESIDENGKVEINIKNDNKNCKIEISDNGKGIPQKDLKNIFTPFYSKKDKGIGLGLSIVKKNIIKNNGKINVESKKDKGTTFYISLPISNMK